MTDRPVFLFACFDVDTAPWLTEIAAALPEVELRVWPDVGDPAGVDYVLAWKAPAEVWSGLVNLKAIFSMGAGVDGLLRDPALPSGPPLVSMSDPGLVTGMEEYVVARVLHHFRDFGSYAALQAAGLWRPLAPHLPQDCRVGVLGLGRLGSACARRLASFGFDVAGWSRRPSQVEGVQAYAGPDELDAFLARTDILVCLLPLTPQTEGILSRSLFARLPDGAVLINVGRGAHLVEDDLLAALDCGQLSGATLDVFRIEPLPAGHPFWSHPKVTVTPHVSAVTHPRTAALSLARNLRRLQRGEPVEGLVDRAAGY